MGNTCKRESEMRNNYELFESYSLLSVKAFFFFKVS